MTNNGRKCTNCGKNASYGYKDDNIRRSCAEHKIDDMVNLTRRKCNECCTTASFGYINGVSSLYCSIHKLEGMVHTSARKERVFTSL